LLYLDTSIPINQLIISMIFGGIPRIKLIQEAIQYQQSKRNIVIILTNNMVDIVYKCLQEIHMDHLIPREHIYGYQTIQDSPLPTKVFDY